MTISVVRFGLGAPAFGASTGGSDFRYSAMAMRSASDSREVLATTSFISPPALMPIGLTPSFR
ncbi:hypothetical protein [Cupriavidus campinensis]